MRKCISFKEKEKYLYLHLLKKRNASDYIKDLIEEDINKKTSKIIVEEIAEDEELTW